MKIGKMSAPASRPLAGVCVLWLRLLAVLLCGVACSVGNDTNSNHGAAAQGRPVPVVAGAPS
jgi:hypothetical protein